MKVKLKKQGDEIRGATLECSVIETLTIYGALNTELLANKTLYKDFNKEEDNKIIERMIADMRGEE